MISSFWTAQPAAQHKRLTAFLSAVFVLLIGLIDYLADYRLLFTVLYVLPIGVATVYVNRSFAAALAVLSVVISNYGDLVGNTLAPRVIIFWNDGIILSLFFIVIYLLHTLRVTLLGLEATIQERTRDLRNEMAERERLEHQTLDLSERERQMFGQELHDVVCQELASVAIASHLLFKKLQKQNAPIAENAGEIARMIDNTLTKTRSLARGFFTAGFDVMGLAEALREIARNVHERTGIICHVQWEQDLAIADEEAVLHLFRIAQEAMQNAVKHSEAKAIEVRLRKVASNILLTIADDGKGLTLSKSGSGLGQRIMRYRAGLIGGTLNIEQRASGGVCVTASVPFEKMKVIK